MMWDIHGNPLKKGHCEVHPHIAEEFPCHVCLEQQQVAYIHDRATQIVDYDAPLLEKIHQVRSMAGLTADQYTVNLLGHIQEDVEALLQKNKNQAEHIQQLTLGLKRKNNFIEKLKDQNLWLKRTVKELKDYRKGRKK